VTEPLDAQTADVVAAVCAASHKRGYDAGYVAGAEFAAKQVGDYSLGVVRYLKDRIKELEDQLPADAKRELIEGGRDKPDA